MSWGTTGWGTDAWGTGTGTPPATGPQLVTLLPFFDGPLQRWENVQFDVVSAGSPLVALNIDLLRKFGGAEPVFTLSGGFTAEYAVGSDVTVIVAGNRVILARRNGWPETPVQIRVTAVDSFGAVLETLL